MNENNRQIAEVLDQIKRNGTTRDALSLLILKLLELRHPEEQIQFVSEAEIKLTSQTGESHTIFLHNIWSECEKCPEERDEIVDRYLKVLAPGKESSKPFGPNMVVPIIRETGYRDYVSESDRNRITKHLVGDLWIVFAVDLPESTDVMTVKQIEALGLGTEQLLSLGIQNVERLFGEISMDPYGECYVFSCQNIVYASSLMLLEYVWKQAAELVQDQLVMAAPARDTILFTAISNRSGIEELKREAAYVVRNGNHVLTEALFTRHNGQWKLFQ